MESFSSMEHVEAMRMFSVGFGLMEDGAGDTGTDGTNSRKGTGGKPSRSGWRRFKQSLHYKTWTTHTHSHSQRAPESGVRLRMFNHSDQFGQNRASTLRRNDEHLKKKQRSREAGRHQRLQICPRPFPQLAVGWSLMPGVSGGNTRVHLHTRCRHFHLTTMREKSWRRSVVVKLLPLGSVRMNPIWSNIPPPPPPPAICGPEMISQEEVKQQPGCNFMANVQSTK